MAVNNNLFLDQCKNYAVFKLIFNEAELLKYEYQNNFFDYFDYFWKYYQHKIQSYDFGSQKLKSLNGSAFNIIIVYLLHRENIQIHAMDDDSMEVKFVKPDIVIKNGDNTYTFVSLKTSLRERWKQADWEAIKFKQKYNSSYCYLLTNNKNEGDKLKKLIDFIDIDAVYHTNEEDFKILIKKLKQMVY